MLKGDLQTGLRIVAVRKGGIVSGELALRGPLGCECHLLCISLEKCCSQHARETKIKFHTLFINESEQYLIVVREYILEDGR